MEKKTIHQFAGNDSVDGLSKKAADYLDMIFVNKPPTYTVHTDMLIRYTSNSRFTAQMVVEMLLQKNRTYFRAKINNKDIIGIKAYEQSIRKFMESNTNNQENEYENVI
jgi:hypothetical protein